MVVWRLVLIQLVTFIFIVLFLRGLLYSHIRSALKRLQQLNRDNIEKEKTLKEEMERAEREAKRTIESAQEEAESIREQSLLSAEKNREDIIVKTKKEAKRLINEAVKDCRRKEMEFSLKMQEKSVYLATDMVKYIFTEQGREALHRQIVDELIEEIKGLEKEKIRAGDDKAKVICAFPLEDGQKKKIEELISAKIERNIEVSTEIDPEITAGFVLKLGRCVIDGSIKNKLKRILTVIKEKTKTF